jgi:hypothetical protein
METLLGNGVNKAIIDYGRLAGGLVMNGSVEIRGQPLSEQVLTHQTREHVGTYHLVEALYSHLKLPYPGTAINPSHFATK